MGQSIPLVAWTYLVTGASFGLLLSLIVAVFAWHERRLATEARRWGVHLLKAQDLERQRIARELHDDMVPRLYAVRLATERGGTLEARDQLGGVMADLRTLAYDLHPPALKHLNLRQALEDLVARHDGADGLTERLEATANAEVGELAATALYRVAQEGLANVRRHADASTVVLRLSTAATATTLTICDDGRGLPASGPARAGFGLRSMRERIEAVGGTLEIRPASPQGTELIATVGRG